MEEILAEGGGFTQCESPDLLKKRNRARVAVLEISELIPDIDVRVRQQFFSSNRSILIFRHIQSLSVFYFVKLFNVIK